MGSQVGCTGSSDAYRNNFNFLANRNITLYICSEHKETASAEIKTIFTRKGETHKCSKVGSLSLVRFLFVASGCSSGCPEKRF